MNRIRNRLLALIFLLAACSGTKAWAFDDDHKVNLNGTTLHFRVRGADKANPYLVILHGGPGFSSHMFYSWGTSLEKTVNVVYLDQRGCGESQRLKFANLFEPKPEETKDYTIANLVKDIEAVRQYLKVDRWFVLGHSWGGMLGLEYVSAHPESVAGYVHMDGLLSVPMVSASICDSAEVKFTPLLQSDDMAVKIKADTILKAAAQIRAIKPDNPQRLTTAYQLALGPAGLYFAGDQQAAFMAFRKRIQDAVQPYSIAPEAMARASEPTSALIINDAYLMRDDQPLLAKITVPTLIINGKQDGIIPPKTAEMVHKGIQKSELLVLDNCGHFPFAEQPEKTTTAILDFFKQHSVKPVN